jgi:mono/diheme cytochrome c family protein
MIRLLAPAAALGAASVALAQAPSQDPPLPVHPIPPSVTGVGILTQPVAPGTPNADQVRRGQYLVVLGDCMSCHLRPGGQPFAGGLGLNTPFGVIYSSNITSDRDTGIGGWSPDQFYRAMHQGIDDQGKNLYPAFPYPWFTRVSRTDTDAILAYLKTTPPVRYTPPANKLPFPMNIRFMVKFWNLLFFRAAPERAAAPEPAGSVERGAEIVNGLGHCSDCHSPKNFLGAEKTRQAFQGGVIDNWVAVDLTSNPHTGLAAWSKADIAELLATGRNARAGAGGSMGDVITYSTSLMSDADREAVAAYLKTLPARPDDHPSQPDAKAMKAGAEVFSDACASCHLQGAVGQPRFFPPLPGETGLQQADATGLIHLILAGGRVGPSQARPSPLTMPSFAWKLSDEEVADVATYVRNSWGNHAQPVSASDVARLRGKLGLKTIRYTDNSGSDRR